MKQLLALISGTIFALGLGISGMTRPDVVRGFLDFFGQWNWHLMGVMMGAIGVHALTFRLIMKRSSPILEIKFQVPCRKDIDGRLIAGSIIFGIGWGWAGICPGPGIVSLASGQLAFVIFLISMLAGMTLFQMGEKLFFKKRGPAV